MCSLVASQLDKFLGIAADSPSHADAIFCFAGKQSRKIFALQLYARTVAPRLILSCARFELRRYRELPNVPPVDLVALAAPVRPELRHFFVNICDGRAAAQLIPKGRLGTLSEVAALASWLRVYPDVRRVIVVSSASHLRRIRYCWNRLVPADISVQFVPEPALHTEDAHELAVELGKCLVYSAYFHMEDKSRGAQKVVKRDMAA